MHRGLCAFFHGYQKQEKIIKLYRAVVMWWIILVFLCNGGLRAVFRTRCKGGKEVFDSKRLLNKFSSVIQVVQNKPKNPMTFLSL